MSEQPLIGETAHDDAAMIEMLHACGFFVRTSGLASGQRPQIAGSIDSAIAFFKLSIAGGDAADALAFAPYLKEGETPLQRLEREIKDSETLAAMLAVERAKLITVHQPAPSEYETAALDELKRRLRAISVSVTGAGESSEAEVMSAIDALHDATMYADVQNVVLAQIQAAMKDPQLVEQRLASMAELLKASIACAARGAAPKDNQ